MRNQKLTRLIFTALIAIFVASPLMSYALSSPYDQLKEIQSKIDVNQDLANEKSAEIKDLKTQISSMDSDISSTQASIGSLNKDIKKQEQEIAKLNGEIKISEEKIQQNKKNLQNLIKLLYEKGDVQALELLASANSLSDLIDAEEYNVALQDKVNKTIGETRELKNKLAEQKKNQENKKKSLEERKSEIVAKQQELYDQKSAKDNLLKITRGDQAKYQQMIKNLEAQRAQVEAEIWRNNNGGSYVNLGNVSKGDIIGYQGNTGYSTGSHLHFEIRNSSYTAYNPASYVGNGYWAHPLAGARVTCGWYCYSGHRGIDYALSYGSPVRASADGIIIARVTGKGNTYPWDYDYGNYVKIKHDNGWYTLYAHLR